MYISWFLINYSWIFIMYNGQNGGQSSQSSRDALVERMARLAVAGGNRSEPLNPFVTPGHNQDENLGVSDARANIEQHQADRESALEQQIRFIEENYPNFLQEAQSFGLNNEEIAHNFIAGFNEIHVNSGSESLEFGSIVKALKAFGWSRDAGFTFEEGLNQLKEGVDSGNVKITNVNNSQEMENRITDFGATKLDSAKISQIDL